MVSDWPAACQPRAMRSEGFSFSFPLFDAQKRGISSPQTFRSYPCPFDQSDHAHVLVVRLWLSLVTARLMQIMQKTVAVGAVHHILAAMVQPIAK